MPVVSSQFIGEWEPVNDDNDPKGFDNRRDGDNNMRAIQGTVRRTFENFAGVAVTPTEAELNQLAGIGQTNTVEERLTKLEDESAKFPGGNTTFIAFWQAEAPTGWRQQTDVQTPGLDNSMLRVVQTAGGGIGGTKSPISMSGTDVPEHPHPVAVAQDGQHTHGAYYASVNAGQQRRHLVEYSPDWLTVNTSSDSPGDLRTGDTDSWILTTDGSHDHAADATANPGGTVNWTPKYVDMIIASKD